MKTLTIKDLGHAEALDRNSMCAVRGGTKMSAPYCPPNMPYPSSTSSIKVDQDLMQFQDVKNLTANGSAFISGVTVDNHTDQFGQNNVSIGYPVVA
jgi:hypothetical protein